MKQSFSSARLIAILFVIIVCSCTKEKIQPNASAQKAIVAKSTTGSTSGSTTNASHSGCGGDHSQGSSTGN